MMIKNTFLIICIAAFLSFNSSISYAKEYNINGTRIEIEDNSVLLPDGVDHSRDEVHNPKRGSIISFGVTNVDNDGNGDMTFTIDTFAHRACDEILHKAFVEVWNEQTEAWDTIETALFVATQEMDPNEPLISLSNSFTIKKLKVGSYYKLSGLHKATLNGVSEILDSGTDGVMNEIN